MNTAITVKAKSANIDALELHFEEQAMPDAGNGECVIEVGSSGVNPSDVKAVLGFMPHAVWPRTPGRDYAGTVVRGPENLIGKAVWGSGGELGIRRNGAHAKYVTVPLSSVREKPTALSMDEAGAVGVPFVTAAEGLRRAGGAAPGKVILVFGANGKVGQATIQLATQAGAQVIGVERGTQAYIGHSSGPITMVAPGDNVYEAVHELTAGHGADIIFNTVGSPYFDQANRSTAMRGVQIFISTIDRAVPFDILEFYRGQRTYVGVDTLALGSDEGARILDSLSGSFEEGVLQPFPIVDDHVFPLERAAEAYRTVFNGARQRVLLKP
ncbi:NADPH:quinone reductase [Paraburkholderia steynii]|uniref:NADPH:quinone reductase n=1 Tax=Paraburkholderia steynii TaxID=1245441 RepID=A0A7Z7BC70_9BURK|nr:zinc-binding alcohol dehydrogenase family protein [Paraburkholderia steynii]SDI50466.1 NADPH:quinone reductase [Paraburkholderia steynii]